MGIAIRLGWLLGAGFFSIGLYFLIHDVWGFTRQSIVIDSLTLAGMLSLLCCAEMYFHRARSK